jgi:chromosome segregation ATPase
MRVEMQALERRLTQSRVDSEDLDRELAAAKQRQADMEARYGPLCEQRDALIAIVAKERQRRDEADQVQPALEAARRAANDAHEARADKLRTQLVRTQRDRDEATATATIMEEEAAVTQRAADAVAVVEVRLEGTRTRRQALEQEREALLRDIEELQRKLAELEAENKSLSGGCCQCQ